MQKHVNILHLSDLHFDNSASQKLLVEPLMRDLDRSYCNSNRPDLMIFSGDLVNNPDQKDIYLYFSDVLENIWRVTGLNENKTIFVPGNHDVSFKYMKDNPLKYKSIQSIRNDESSVKRAYESGEISDYAHNLSKDFFDFCELLGIKWSCPFSKSYTFKELDLEILAFNTAAFCGLEGSPNDRGRLSLPINSLVQTIAKSSITNKMSVGHHPISDFNEAISRNISRLVEKYSSAHFFGHLHDAKPTIQISANGSLLNLQSGALHTSDHALKGFYFAQININDKRHRVFVRTYKDPRGEFDEGNEISEKGVFPAGEQTDRYWLRLSSDSELSDFREWLATKAAYNIKQSWGPNFGKKELDSIFVFPPLALASQDGEEALGRVDELWNKLKLIDEQNNIVIKVPEEFGASSLMNFIAFEICRMSSRLSRPSVPISIDIRAVKDYPASALRAIKQGHPLSDDNKYGWNTCENSIPVTLLIDNYENGNSTHLAALRLLVKMCKHARFIIAVRTRLAIADHAVPVAIELPFQHLELSLRPFNRARVRELVKRWGVPAAFTEDYVVDSITQRFQSLSIPLAAPHISMFLRVLDSQKSFSPINASTVIEHFVEELLDKPNMERMFRTSMDFRETSDLLGVIAEKFIRSDDYAMDNVGVIDIIVKYYSFVGIERDSVGILNYFPKIGVFDDAGGRICFKYNVSYSYFIAFRMNIDVNFREFILSYENIDRFVHEVDLYCGISRRDESALELVGDFYKRAWLGVPSELKSFAEQSVLVGLKLPFEKDFNEFVSQFAEALPGAPENQEDRDEMVGGPVSSSQFKQNLARRKFDNSIFKWVLVLRAYTVCLKNLETIESTKKEEHLAIILDGWAKIAAFTVSIVGLCMENRELKLSDKSFKLDLSKVDGRIMRTLLILVPSMLATFLRADLGTEKLKIQLLQAHPRENPVVDLFRIGLMASLKIEGFIVQLEKYMKDMRKDRYLLGAMSWQIRDIYLRFGFSDNEEKTFRRLIAELEADQAGLRGTDRDKRVAESMAKIGRRKTLQDMRK